MVFAKLGACICVFFVQGAEDANYGHKARGVNWPTVPISRPRGSSRPQPRATPRFHSFILA